MISKIFSRKALWLAVVALMCVYSVAPDFLSGREENSVVSTVQAADLLGTVAQSKFAPQPDANGNCPGVNYITGGAMTQPAYGSGGRRYCPGIYTCDPANPPSCINPVTGAQMTPGYSCQEGVYTTGMGSLSSRLISQGNLTACARQGVEWRFSGTQAGRRMPGVGTYIDKNGCYVKYTWGSGNARATGFADSQLVCPTAVVNGSFVYGTNTAGQTGNTTEPGPNGSTVTTVNTGGSSQTSGGGLVGWIETATLTDVVGWALYMPNPSLSVKVRGYLKAQGTNQLTFIGEATANLPRPDLIGQLSLAASASNAHGFTFKTPSGAKAGDTIIVYGVNPANGWNPSLGEKVIGSATASAPASYGNIGTAISQGGGATGGNVTVASFPASGGTSPRTWAEWVSACAQFSPSTLCMATPSDGGYSCAVSGPGVTEDEKKLCEARFSSCIGSGRGGVGGFCDADKIVECREAGSSVTDRFGRPLVDWAGRVDTEACNQYLWDNGCSGNPAGCRAACVLPGGNRPADCPAGTGGGGGGTGGVEPTPAQCLDSRGMPMRCDAPGPTPAQCLDSRGMPMRCPGNPPSGGDTGSEPVSGCPPGQVPGGVIARGSSVVSCSPCPPGSEPTFVYGTWSCQLPGYQADYSNFDPNVFQICQDGSIGRKDGQTFNAAIGDRYPTRKSDCCGMGIRQGVVAGNTYEYVCEGGGPGQPIPTPSR